MTAVSQQSRNAITLRGSTAIVSEFFGYAINSILYQRAIYPESTFEAKKCYNLQIMVTKNPELQSYLNSMLQQIQAWLLKGDIRKLVVIIASIKDGTVLERWVFNIETDKTVLSGDSQAGQQQSHNKKSNKSVKDIQNEIRGIIRQITSSVTFLPLLEVACSFDILIHTDSKTSIPKKWQETQPQYITNSEVVRLRSFNTTVHKVEAMVSYKVMEEDDDDEDEDDEMLAGFMRNNIQNENVRVQNMVNRA